MHVAFRAQQEAPAAPVDSRIGWAAVPYNTRWQREG